MNNLPKVVTQRCPEQDLNLRPSDRKPKCLTVTPPCPLVVHYWADLKSVQGFRCYDNIVQSLHGFHCSDSIAANAKCQRVLELTL